jgi:AcrR family transcriptional regulator
MVVKKENESPKCRKLLETGRKLFWKHGFKRVSIDEICREANVSKMTFYRCFENKIDLAKKIYTEMVEKGMDKFNAIMAEDIPPTEKLKKIIILKMESTDNISSEFINDFYKSNDTGLKSFVEETVERSWNEIISGFRLAQKKGWFRKDFKPEFLFYITQHLTPMYTDENLLALYNSPQDLIMEFANFFTYGIAPHK